MNSYLKSGKAQPKQNIPSIYTEIQELYNLKIRYTMLLEKLGSRFLFLYPNLDSEIFINAFIPEKDALRAMLEMRVRAPDNCQEPSIFQQSDKSNENYRTYDIDSVAQEMEESFDYGEHDCAYFENFHDLTDECQTQEDFHQNHSNDHHETNSHWPHIFSNIHEEIQTSNSYMSPLRKSRIAEIFEGAHSYHRPRYYMCRPSRNCESRNPYKI